MSKSYSSKNVVSSTRKYSNMENEAVETTSTSQFSYKYRYRHNRKCSTDRSQGSLNSYDHSNDAKTIDTDRGLDSKYLSGKQVDEPIEEEVTRDTGDTQGSITISSLETHLDEKEKDKKSKKSKKKSGEKSKFGDTKQKSKRSSEHDSMKSEEEPMTDTISNIDDVRQMPRTEVYHSRHKADIEKPDLTIETGEDSQELKAKPRQGWDFSSVERKKEDVRKMRAQVVQKPKKEKQLEDKKSATLKKRKDIQQFVPRRVARDQTHKIVQPKNMLNNTIDQNVLCQNLEKANNLLSSRNLSTGRMIRPRATSVGARRGSGLYGATNRNVSNSSRNLMEIAATPESRLMQLSKELIENVELSMKAPGAQCTETCAKLRVENISLKKQLELQKEKYDNMIKMYKEKVSRVTHKYKHAQEMVGRREDAKRKLNTTQNDYDGFTKDIMLNDYQELLKTLHDANLKLKRSSVEYRDMADERNYSSSKILSIMIAYLKKEAKMNDDKPTSRNFEYKKRACSTDLNRSAVFFKPRQNLDSTFGEGEFRRDTFGTEDELDTVELNSRVEMTPIHSDRFFRSPRRL